MDLGCCYRPFLLFKAEEMTTEEQAQLFETASAFAVESSNSPAGEARRAGRRARRAQRKENRQERRARIKARLQSRRDAEATLPTVRRGPPSGSVQAEGAPTRAQLFKARAVDTVSAPAAESKQSWWMDPKIWIAGVAAYWFFMRKPKSS